jgi:hypothetical protein
MMDIEANDFWECYRPATAFRSSDAESDSRMLSLVQASGMRSARSWRRRALGRCTAG